MTWQSLGFFSLKELLAAHPVPGLAVSLAPHLQLAVTPASHNQVPLQVQAPDRALQVSSPGRKQRRFVKSRKRLVPQAPSAAAAASLLGPAAQGAGTAAPRAETSLSVRGREASEVHAVGGVVLFIHFTNQAAEVIPALLLATAHSTEPRL